MGAARPGPILKRTGPTPLGPMARFLAWSYYLPNVSVMRKLSECVTRPMNRALSRPTKWCMRITIYTCFLACGGTWKDACIYKFIYIYMHLIIIIRHITTKRASNMRMSILEHFRWVWGFKTLPCSSCSLLKMKDRLILQSPILRSTITCDAPSQSLRLHNV